MATIGSFTGAVEPLGINAKTTIKPADKANKRRGFRPATMVNDSGTKLTSHAILCWQEEGSVLWHHSAPDKPQQNGFCGKLQRSVPRNRHCGIPFRKGFMFYPPGIGKCE